MNVASETREDRALLLNPTETWGVYLLSWLYLEFTDEIDSLLENIPEVDSLPNLDAVKSVLDKLDVLIGRLPEEEELLN